MRKVLLLYNPQSGRNHHRREEEVRRAAEMFRAAGVETEVASTAAPGSAGAQAREAADKGCDAVIACGGDGTAHEVLQGIAGSEVEFGFIPLGTGNALGQDLGLSRDPEQSARMLLRSQIRRVPLGLATYQTPSGPAARYFLTVAGLGADAEMLYRLALEWKKRYGMLAYYTMAARLWLGHEFVPFQVEFTDLDRNLQRQEQVSQLLVVRVSDFGGILRQLSLQATLARPDFQLVLFKTNKRIRYLHYVMGTFSRRHWPVHGIETVRASSVSCTPLPNSRRVYLQADGELLGTLPVQLQMVTETVSLLVPQHRLDRFRSFDSAAVSMAALPMGS